MGKNNSDFKDKIENTFDDISPVYDEMHEEWMKYSTRIILNEIKLPENPVCLDIACGTGLSTFQLAEACRGKGTIYGIDISEKMLDEANGALQRQGLGNISFMKMDAENIEFPDSTFDLVLSTMSLTFFPDKQKALSEMHRVLKPGGQFALTYPAGPYHREVFDIAYTVASRHPELPGFLKAVEDVRGCFLGLDESVDLLNRVGLRLTNIYGRYSIGYVSFGWLVSDQGLWWSIFRQVLPPEAVSVIRSEFDEAVRAAVAPEEKLKVTTYMIFAWGTKPG